MSSEILPPADMRADVIRAAGYAGRALGLYSIASMGTDTNKTAAWEAEFRAWEQRVDTTIDSAPFGQETLSAVAREAHIDGNAVIHLRHSHAAKLFDFLNNKH